MIELKEDDIVKLIEPDLFVVILRKLETGNYFGVVEFTNGSHLIVVREENIEYVVDEIAEQN